MLKSISSALSFLICLCWESDVEDISKGFWYYQGFLSILIKGIFLRYFFSLFFI